MEVSETVGQGEIPTAQVQQLSFSELRNRLPKEITDDVMRHLNDPDVDNILGQIKNLME